MSARSQSWLHFFLLLPPKKKFCITLKGKFSVSLAYQEDVIFHEIKEETHPKNIVLTE